MANTIQLDFGGSKRRHSFLPDNWDQVSNISDLSNISNIRFVQIEDEDDLFSYMQAGIHYIQKPLKKFCTGSKYLGQWNKLGIAGKGLYKYPHGVIFDGYFNKNGDFHGPGMLLYPSGEKIEGLWKNGKLNPNPNFVSKGGTILNKKYCQMPDRRFQVELKKGMNPVGQEYLTDEEPPPREIPEGCYDLVAGYYDPKIVAVMDYPKIKMGISEMSLKRDQRSSKHIADLFAGDDKEKAIKMVKEATRSEKDLKKLMGRDICEESNMILWIPSPHQIQWIVKNCRTAWEEPVRYRPDLYEHWEESTREKGSSDEEGEQEDVLEELNLEEINPETRSNKRLLSFVQNSKSIKENETVDVLSKMFKHYVRMRSNMDFRMLSFAKIVNDGTSNSGT